MNTYKTLHILNKTPDHSRSRLCFSAFGPGDGLLLTEDGVLTVTQSLGIEIDRCFALAPDLEARGLSSQISSDQIVSFEDMVNLTASAENVICW